MSETVIRVENLSKKYVIAHQQANQNPTLKDAFAGTAKSIIQRLRSPFGSALPRMTKEEFWALDDISFHVARGERIGIIGRNGAGKSTLLKILSRITEPTKGRVVIKGRVASLLEVGTGFHPELTGRENIFLNGAVLGMSKAETKKKFDEIIDFAEIEKFLDTPVKRYSSGMYVRLAFAVAAHLEPEILIVDEVLAVGDAAFQKKCLGKMQHIASEGRTVLFVSHNMPSISGLTRTCILLDRGCIASIGETERVVADYLRQFDNLIPSKGSADFASIQRDPGRTGRKARLQNIRVLNSQEQVTSIFSEGKPITLEIGFRTLEEVQAVQLGCTVRARDGNVDLFTTPSPEFVQIFPPSEYSVRVALNPNYLRVGEYVFTLRLFSDGQLQDRVKEAIGVVIQPGTLAVENPSYFRDWVKGKIRFDYEWSLAKK